MSKKILAIVTFILLISMPFAAAAETVKVFVAEFAVTGAPNREELKLTLPRILASRLDKGQVQLVASEDRADLLLTGSYALFGKFFTLDVLLRNRDGSKMSMVNEQGEMLDDLIPALGRLAQKIGRELTQPQTVAVPAPASQPLPVPVATATTERYVIKANNDTSASWTSEPLDDVLISLALGRTFSSGERELFVATDHSIRVLRKGTELKQITEIVIPVPARILAIDTADLDHDGIPELYVTIMDRESLSSRVYLPTETSLKLLAENLPWFFRTCGAELEKRILFAQKMDTNGGFYNGIASVVKAGSVFELSSDFKLPRAGNIFNFSRFRDKANRELMVILDEDGYIAVFSADGKELWKSGDKFGGSETYFNHAPSASVRTMGDQLQWHFLEQRISPLADGIVLVPHNEGVFSVGNNRSYNKSAVYALKWTGALFKEVWHTPQMPSYLADYVYDPSTRDLILLEVVQKKGVLTKGKTTISISKVE